MSSSEPIPPVKPTSPPAERGFTRVGKAIARRTTDLLAIAILAIGGLMVGGRLSEWWTTEPEDVVSPQELSQKEAGSPGDWGLDGMPVTLEFGDSPQSLRRLTIRGPEEKAVHELTAWCRETVRDSDYPTTPAGADEVRLLGQLERLKPAGEVPGRGPFYRIDRPLLMVLGLRNPPGGTSPPVRKADGREPDGRESEKLADASAPGRVVCWGFAFPVDKDSWTLFLSALDGAGRGKAALPDVPFPQGSRRILSLRNDAGDGLIGLTGTGEPSAWKSVFDDWFSSNGWFTVRKWSEIEGRWSARFASPKSDVPDTGWRGTIDVQITRADEGKLSGLLNFLPDATGAGHDGDTDTRSQKK